MSTPKLDAIRQAALGTDSKEPPADDATLQQQRAVPAAPAPAPGNKDTNFRALAQSKEQAERERDELKTRLAELEAKANVDPDPKWKRLNEEIELNYENDPDKFFSWKEQVDTERQEWEQKIKEKDEQVKKISLIHSDDYQRNVTQPIQTAKADISLLLDDDKEALDKLSKIIHDEKGRLNLGATSIEEMKQIKAMLAEAGIDVPVTELRRAIDSFKDATKKGLDYATNYERNRQQQEQEETRLRLQQGAEMERQNKLIRTRQKTAARNGFNNTLKDLAPRIPGDVADEIFSKVHQDLEDTIAGTKPVVWEDAYTTNALAETMRRWIADGTLEKGFKAIEALAAMKKDGDGSAPRRSFTPNGQPSGARASLAMIEEATGIKSGLR